ncbi:MAG: CPBP family intramembrane metalloprotease [Oleibacter sp.]|nr:CPBP family intramembrane metalloprotease [Thalassolituus sp.]
MNFFTWCTPKFIGAQIRDIDAGTDSINDAEEHRQERLKVWKIIGVACLCLLLVHYGKYGSNLDSIVRWLDSVFAVNNQWWLLFYHSEYRDLFSNLWWGTINLLGFLIIPMLTVRFMLKASLKDYGWQWGDVDKHWPGYLLLATPIICFAIIASFGSEFSSYYPFYKHASRSWFDLLAWECIYILQFVAVEFFFRGFLVNGLRRLLGSLSVAVMCLPYLMLHFPKLWPESFGAILFGFFLGILALMSRSIWGGVGVHVSIALTMDFAALIQTKGLPDHW